MGLYIQSVHLTNQEKTFNKTNQSRIHNRGGKRKRKKNPKLPPVPQMCICKPTPPLHTQCWGQRRRQQRHKTASGAAQHIMSSAVTPGIGNFHFAGNQNSRILLSVCSCWQDRLFMKFRWAGRPENLWPCMCVYGVYVCCPFLVSLSCSVALRLQTRLLHRLRYQWRFLISAVLSGEGAPIQSQQSGSELLNGLPSCQSRRLITVASSPRLFRTVACSVLLVVACVGVLGEGVCTTEITHSSWFSVLVSTALGVLFILNHTAITRRGLGRFMFIVFLVKPSLLRFPFFVAFICWFQRHPSGLFSPFSNLCFVLFSFGLNFAE